MEKLSLVFAVWSVPALAWSAIAFSSYDANFEQTNMTVRVGYFQPTEALAKSLAIRRCQASGGGAGCSQLVVARRQMCMAVAATNDGQNVSWGFDSFDQPTARANALAGCVQKVQYSGSCVVRDSVCDTKSCASPGKYSACLQQATGGFGGGTIEYCFSVFC